MITLYTQSQPHYKLGECIGKGAFGSVFKALETTTGKVVAIKQIRLSNESEILAIMMEIDLLKELVVSFAYLAPKYCRV